MLTNEFLDSAFGVVDPIQRLDSEISQFAFVSEQVLKVVNSLNQNEDAELTEKHLNELTFALNRKTSSETQDTDKLLDKVSFEIPETVQDIYLISNTNRKKNKQKKKANLVEAVNDPSLSVNSIIKA